MGPSFIFVELLLHVSAPVSVDCTVATRNFQIPNGGHGTDSTIQDRLL